MGRNSVGVDGTAAVDRFAEQVEDAAERLLADRHGDGLAGVDDFHAAHQAVGGAQGDAADAIAAELLLHLAGQMDRDALVVGVDAEGVVDLRQMAFVELGVERRADDLHDMAGVLAVAVVIGSGNHGKLRGCEILPVVKIQCGDRP